MKALDNTVHGMGVHLLRIPWRYFEYEDGDPDHFTMAGMRAFSNTLASQVVRLGVNDRVLIVADSTVDHQNWKESGWKTRTTYAHDCLYEAFQSHMPTAQLHVESDAGAGYTAQGVRGNTLLDLLENGLRCCNPTAVIVLGGWNDAGSDVDKESVNRLWYRVRHYMRVES